MEMLLLGLDYYPRDHVDSRDGWQPRLRRIRGEEARERRRFSETVSGGAKKAEAAQAEGNGADEPDSGRAGRSGDE